MTETADLEFTMTPSPLAVKANAACLHSILIVDDNQDSAECLAMLLKLSGHEVYTAFNGPSALEISLLQSPKVVLLDLGLPEMDGFEICRRLRVQENDTRQFIVALTGYDEDEDVRRCLESGFDMHLLKPINVETLTAILDERLQSTAAG